MIPRECKRLAEVDFPIAEVSRHSARERSSRHHVTGETAKIKKVARDMAEKDIRNGNLDHTPKMTTASGRSKMKNGMNSDLGWRYA